MSDQELQEQYKRCEEWMDARQWKLLAVAYFTRGYLLNALHCIERADDVCERAEAGQVTA